MGWGPSGAPGGGRHLRHGQSARRLESRALRLADARVLMPGAVRSPGEDADGAVEEISTDDRDIADVSEVAGQLAGATSQIADQLSMITEEMNTLRSELYSDNGLGSIRSELDALRSGGLEQIQQQVEQIESAATAASSASRSCAGSRSAASSSRARAPVDRADDDGTDDRADTSRSRRVSFDRDTRDVARRHGDGKVAMPVESRAKGRPATYLPIGRSWPHTCQLADADRSGSGRVGASRGGPRRAEMGRGSGLP